jgi:putative ABC transport system permease protein
MSVSNEALGGRLLPLTAERPRRSGMSMVEAFRIALAGLVANKMRSFLTMLGVIVGVASVIVMVALGEGAAQKTREAIQKMGTNRLYVRPEEQSVRGVKQGGDSGESLKLTDVEVIRKLPWVAAVAPEYRNGGVRVKYQAANSLTEVYGSTPEYFKVRNLPIEKGRSFTNAEVQSKARVAVLGYEVYEELFDGSDALGKTVKINGKSFTVIGLLKRMGSGGFGNKDDTITVPITTAMQRLFGAQRDRVRSISVQCSSEDKMKDLEEDIIATLGRVHGLNPGDPPDVRIFNQADMMETANEQSGFLTMLLAGVALVSLIVGGIGIMNIMLVSVTERTREIGIRKAIGAKRRDILYQFLIESVTLSIGGGMLGIGIGLLVSTWMGRLPDEGGLGFPMLLTATPMIISFGFSALVGVFFGIYPALKASGLDPIEALRYD